MIFLGPIVTGYTLALVGFSDRGIAQCLMVGGILVLSEFLYWDFTNDTPILEVTPMKYWTEYQFENEEVGEIFYALNPTPA